MDSQEIDGGGQPGGSAETPSEPRGTPTQHHSSTVASPHNPMMPTIDQSSRASSPSGHLLSRASTNSLPSHRPHITPRRSSPPADPRERDSVFDAGSSRQSLDDCPSSSRSPFRNPGTADSTACTTPPPPDERSDDEVELSNSFRKLSIPDVTSSRSREISKESFCRHVYMVKKSLGVEPVVMSFDSQSEENILSQDKADSLGLELTDCAVTLSPLRIGSAISTQIVARRKVTVDWYFELHSLTQTTTFLVVDMQDYDAILGKDYIAEHGILKVGDNVPGRRGIPRLPN